MKVSVDELMWALRVSKKTIGRWVHEGRDFIPLLAVVETEDLAAVLGLDHKILIAFLAGYDMPLFREEAASMLGKTASQVTRSSIKPVLHRGRVVRWSFRAVAHAIAHKIEASNANKLSPGCFLLPTADAIPGFDILKP